MALLKSFDQSLWHMSPSFPRAFLLGQYKIIQYPPDDVAAIEINKKVLQISVKTNDIKKL